VSCEPLHWRLRDSGSSLPLESPDTDGTVREDGCQERPLRDFFKEVSSRKSGRPDGKRESVPH
jgi:hypothetical protein